MAKTENKKHGANLPNLRFPGFAGDWEEKRLGEIVKFKTTNSFSRDNLNYEKGSVKNIHYGDIHTKFQTLFDIEHEKVPYVNENISLQRISEENYCQEGDIIFADASEDLNDIGKSIEIVNLNNEKLISGLHTLLARPEPNIFHKGFAGYVLKSNGIRKQISKESQGAKVLGITAGRLSKVNISIPDLDEQRKIAELFSVLDGKIISLKKTIEDFIKLKNEIFTKLISQKIRFKDCGRNSFPEWNEIELKEFLSQKNERNSRLENTLVLSVSNKKGFVTQEEQFDGYEVASKDLSNYKIVRKNDFAYNPSRINVGSIAILNNFESGIVSPMYIVFEIKGKLNPTYFLNLFQTHEFKYKIKSSCAGSVRESLNFSDLCNFSIFLPTIEEQKKIAEFLKTMDSKIELEKEILQKLELQKKFLLRNVFV